MKRYLALESLLTEFPRQWVLGFRSTHALLRAMRKPRVKPKAVLIAGMGGSSLPGKLLETFARIEKLPHAIWTWNTYGLPAALDKNTLVVAISYSGNTEETITSFKQAYRRKIPCAVIATGGALLLEARRRRVPAIAVPEAMSPRFALGYLFGGLVALLVWYGIIPVRLVRVETASQKVSQKKIQFAAQALAQSLHNRIPLVYTSDDWSSLGTVWKLALNETSKLPAFAYTLPEMNHNELEALATGQFGTRFVGLFIEDPQDPKVIQKRFHLTRKIFKKRAKIPVVRLRLQGSNFFEKALSNISLGFWTSYFFAIARGIHPIQNKTIEEFKRQMR